MTLRTATPADLGALAALHRRAFPEAFLTQLGRRFLERYYGLALEYVGGIVLVAEQNGEIVGLAAGCIEPALFRRVLRSAKFDLAAAALPALLSRVSLLRRLGANFRRTALAGGGSGRERGGDCELASLAVEPDWAGRGFGSVLVEAFAGEARSQGATAVVATTDAQGNERVNRFYDRLGFELQGSFVPYSGRTLNTYVRALEASDAGEATSVAPAALGSAEIARRLFDLTASGAGLAAAAPVIGLLAVAVKLSDGGPAFYRHERVGRFGRRFRMWKLRTMVVNADRIGGALTAGHDPRVTPIGRLLRRFKLDEAPQLLNVLSGEMSLVGPRPESPRYVELRDPRWRQVLSVRPGVTDLASLAYRNEEDLLAAVSDRELYYRNQLLPAKLALSIEGIVRRSWLFELRLVLYTLRYSLFPRAFDAAMIRRAFVEDARA